MSVRRIAREQPSDFAFTAQMEETVRFWLDKYPQGRERSAVIPLLWLAQKQEGWVSEPAMRHIGDRLGMPYIRVLEVATFYTMFHLKPVGRHHLQVCGTTPCMLRGSDKLIAVCRKRIGAAHTVTADGALSWEEMECMGACVNAPIVAIDDYYHEDLDAASFEALIDRLLAGETVTPGSAIGRQTSAPEGGAQTLKDPSLYDGSLGKPLRLPNLPEAAPAPVAKAEPPPPGKQDAEKKARPEAKAVAPASGATVAETRPALLDKPDGAPDDLKRISGVGPKLEGLLNEMGVWHFRQIAAWTAAEVAWVDARLKFKGRIERDDWIAQARVFAAEASS